jgi:hypothetical protein
MRPDLNIIYGKSLFSVFKKPSFSIKMLQLSKKKLQAALKIVYSIEKSLSFSKTPCE